MNLKDKNINKKHSKELGFKTPDDYFLKSKNEILSKISTKKELKLTTFYKNKITWFAAAGFALFFAFTLYKQYKTPKDFDMNQIVLDTLNTQKNGNLLTDSFHQDDILIASLFVNDANVDSFLTNNFIDNVLADEYIDEYIVDELMTDELF